MKTFDRLSISATLSRGDEDRPETEDTSWKPLYRVGGVAALVMVVFIPIQIIVFIIWPPPANVLDWFTLFQKNWLVGLIDMDLLLIVDQVLMSLILLALYTILRRTSQAYTLIAVTLGMLGIAAYFASATAFNMLSLSDQYAAATTEAQKAMFLAAGQATVATWQGAAFDIGYILEGIGLLIMAVVMLKSPTFNRRIAYVGIVLGVMSLIPPTLGIVGMVFALGSLLPLVAWNILLALRFFELAKTTDRQSLWQPSL